MNNLETKNMAKKTKKQKAFSLVKGFKDIIPDDQFYWNFVREKFFSIANAYGFERIDLPIIEDSKLFVRGVGIGTDIVSKEMFSFETPGKEKVSMRPEGTAGVVRAYIEHGMLNKKKPVKLSYSGPMFRYDRPQSGRYRQFYQFGLEIFGEESPIIDAQLIFMAYKMFEDLGIEVDVQVNSIGCKKCRPRYEKALKTYLKKNKKNMCPNCQDRYTKSILRVLDCKERKCRPIIEEAPQIVDYLCEDCNKNFVKILEYLDDIEIPYSLNPFIVRGLDYYNGTTFEIFPKGENKSQSALGAGGRYDGLVKELGGQKTPAIGLAVGIDRVVKLLKEKEDSGILTNRRCDLFVAQLGEKAKKKGMILFDELRKANFNVAENISKTSLKQQLEDANRLKTKLALIIGQKEILDKTILIRDMESGNQEVVPDDKIVPVLTRRLNSLNIKK